MATCRRTPGADTRRLCSHPLPYLLRRQPGNADDFIPAGLAGGYGNGRSRHLQKFGKEFDAGVVGSTVDRSAGQGDFERLAEFAGDRVLLRAGMDFDGKGGPPGPSLTGIIERCQCLARQNVVRTRNKTRAIPIET
jgi:hypothetical protein